MDEYEFAGHLFLRDLSFDFETRKRYSLSIPTNIELDAMCLRACIYRRWMNAVVSLEETKRKGQHVYSF